MRFLSPEEFNLAVKRGIVLECKGQSPMLFVAGKAETTQEFDLRPASAQRDRLMAFATEYEALCRKHSLQITSCGCCDSPWLTEIDGVPAEKPVFIDDVAPDNIVQRVTAYCEKENI